MKKAVTWVMFLLMIPELIQPEWLQKKDTWVPSHPHLLPHIAAAVCSQKPYHPRVTGLGGGCSQEPSSRPKMTGASSSVMPPPALLCRGPSHSTQTQTPDTLHLGAGPCHVSAGHPVNLNNSALCTHFKVLTRITSKESLLNEKKKKKVKSEKPMKRAILIVWLLYLFWAREFQRTDKAEKKNWILEFFLTNVLSRFHPQMDLVSSSFLPNPWVAVIQEFEELLGESWKKEVSRLSFGLPYAAVGKWWLSQAPLLQPKQRTGGREQACSQSQRDQEAPRFRQRQDERPSEGQLMRAWPLGADARLCVQQWGWIWSHLHYYLICWKWKIPEMISDQLNWVVTLRLLTGLLGTMLAPEQDSSH